MSDSSGPPQTLTLNLETTRFARVMLPYLAFPVAAGLTTDEVLRIGLKLAYEAADAQAGVVWLLRSEGIEESVAKQQLHDDVAERLHGLASEQPELRRALASPLPTLLGVAIENAQQYDSAHYLAERDSVTGLHNHRSLHKRLEEEFNRA